MTQERIEEMRSAFWAETEEEETWEWREELTAEEAELVASWDCRVLDGMLRLCEDILAAEKERAAQLPTCHIPYQDSRLFARLAERYHTGLTL